MGMTNEYGYEVIALTRGPKHHFFGYYDIQTWDSTGKYILAMESDFDDRFPTAADAATIGMIEWETGEFHPLAETRAWNLQQGCMLHWLSTAPDRKIIYNDRDGNRFVSIILDVFTGHKRVLPRPVAGLTNDGRHAFSLNYARMRQCRLCVGYSGIDDPNIDVPHPADDGVFLMDLETGDSDLIVSFADAFEVNPIDDIRDQIMWFNHTTVNTDDTRFQWHTCYAPKTGPFAGKPRVSALFVANLNGGDPIHLTPYRHVSHWDWFDPDHLLIWTNMEGQGECFYLINVVTRDFEAIARDRITRDGHCCFTRDGRRLVVDTYPDENRMQTLQLWDMREERLEILGRFHAPPHGGDVRCDLHPRWDRRDRWVTFDSIHEGSRQVYAIDTTGRLRRSRTQTAASPLES